MYVIVDNQCIENVSLILFLYRFLFFFRSFDFEHPFSTGHIIDPVNTNPNAGIVHAAREYIRLGWLSENLGLPMTSFDSQVTYYLENKYYNDKAKRTRGTEG
jgi:hypothetical protein